MEKITNAERVSCSLDFSVPILIIYSGTTMFQLPFIIKEDSDHFSVVTVVVKLRVLLLLLVVVALLSRIILLLLGGRLLLLLDLYLLVDRSLLSRVDFGGLLVHRLLIFGLSLVIFHGHLFLLFEIVDLLARIHSHRAREGRSFGLLALHVRFASRDGIGKIHDLGPSCPVEGIEADLDGPVFLVLGHAARKFHCELHQLI
jgi:hypothetical protein